MHLRGGPGAVARDRPATTDRLLSGGLFYLSWDGDISAVYGVDWSGGPPTELILDSALRARLVPALAPANWGPRWMFGGFNFHVVSSTSPRWRSEGFVVPYWVLFLVLAWPAYRRLRRAWIGRQRRKKGLCLYCGYDLRASGDICPECGHSVREPSVSHQAPHVHAGLRARCGRRWPIFGFGVIALTLVVVSWGVVHGRHREPQAVRLQPGMALPKDHLPPRVELETAPGLWMRFALIPSGRFVMGSPPDEAGRSDLYPGDPTELQHAVIISRAFYMGQTCVTEERYETVMGADPSHHKGAKDPVGWARWENATEFCRLVSKRTGRNVRLPTESQWEYACRAGTTTPFNTGRTLPRSMAMYDWRTTFPGNRVEVPFSQPVPQVAVGSFPPNAWGLYDMHGGVSEWCSDWLGDYPTGEVTDPTGPKKGHLHAQRGGCWLYIPRLCRSACRQDCSHLYQFVSYGLRVVLLPEGGE